MGDRRHLIVPDPGAAYVAALRPWLQVANEQAWSADKPSAVLLPTPFAAAALKRRLALEGQALLGIDILTPGRLRQALHAGSPPIAVREDLQLLLRLAARRFPDDAFAQAVARDPAAFLRDWDALDAAGCSPRVFPFPAARELGAALYELLEACGLCTTHQADREACTSGPYYAQLCISGFGPEHAQQRYLLQAASQAADAVTYIEYTPLSDAPADFHWSETMEYLHGPGSWLDAAQHTAEETPQRTFFLAEEPGQAADVILKQLSQWLHSEDCRIAVCFASREQPLWREVSTRLAQAGIPHQDTAGHVAPRPPGFLLLENWRAMQESQRLEEALAFITCLRTNQRLLPPEADALVHGLRRAFTQALTDDLAVLCQVAARDKTVAAFFEAWPPLPAESTWEAYMEAVRPVLEAFAWPERLDFVSERFELLAGRISGQVSRSAFLGWLGLVVDVPGRMRSPLGQEAFAPLALVTLEDALQDSWTHVLFAGMNAAAWQPEGADQGLLTESLCHELNLRAGYLADGLTGLPERGRLLTQSDAIARQEAAFAYACQCQVALTASRHESATAMTPSPVNDLYLGAFHLQHGKALDHNLSRALGEQTRAWLEESTAPETPPELGHFAAVHANRRNRALPFDGYFFGYDAPPAGGLAFSCSGWESVFTQPGQAWIEQAIGAEPSWSPDDDEPERLVCGTWVHRWLELAQAGAAAVPLPSLNDWQALIEARAEALRQRLAGCYEAADRSLPDWWEELHATARRNALQLAEQVAGSGLKGEVNAEYTLPAEPLVLVPGVLTLPLRGRIDLLIHTAKDAALVVDFKTGKRDALKASRLLKGDGLQLALYTLALSQLGYAEVAASLLTPERRLEPQLEAAELHAAELQPLWQALAQMHRSGTVGHRPAFRDPFRHVGTYPLATLAIPQKTLQAKWQLTHPTLKPKAAS